MITLFRRLRQKLIDSGSVTKYLLYAIGEILLVVIGILIALQVNNWNEDRKEQKKVSSYIQSLSSELEQNRLFLEERIEMLQQDSLESEQIKNRLKSPRATKDTLVHIMRNEFDNNFTLISQLNMSTYESLQNTGDLALLDPVLVRDLQRLQFLIEDLFVVTEKVSAQWVDTLYEYYAQYPSPESVGQRNFMLYTAVDLVWDEAEMTALSVASNMILEFKESSITSTTWRARAVKKQIVELLQQLQTDFPGLEY